MTDAKPLHRPRMMHYLTEGHRATADLAGFAAWRPLLPLGRVGDGRHVLVIPGLMADDQSTVPLRRLLKDAGYRPHAWGLGRNIGPTRAIVDGLQSRAEELAGRDDAPISVIGWSLGGLLARETAALRPECVDRVITLGSPLNITDPVQSRASAIYDMFTERHLPDYSFESWSARRATPEVPLTSVYTRADGIVHWEACLIPESPRTENVEVYGSHCGLGANAAASYVVLDRLEASLEDWQPFQVPAHLRRAFPVARAAARAAA